MLAHLVGFLILLNLTNGYYYKGFFEDDLVFKPCEDDPDNFITNWFNLSNFAVEIINDDETILNGTVVARDTSRVKATDILFIDVEIFKKVRGLYQQPMAQLKRSNFCLTMFSPQKIWYQYTGTIDPKDRTCPPVPGTTYHLHNWSSKVLRTTMPNPNFEGQYRGIVNIGVNDEERYHYCMTIDVRVEKVKYF